MDTDHKNMVQWWQRFYLYSQQFWTIKEMYEDIVDLNLSNEYAKISSV